MTEEEGETAEALRRRAALGYKSPDQFEAGLN
jgi:hypothetical protein